MSADGCSIVLDGPVVPVACFTAWGHGERPGTETDGGWVGKAAVGAASTG